MKQDPCPGCGARYSMTLNNQMKYTCGSIYALDSGGWGRPKRGSLVHRSEMCRYAGDLRALVVELQPHLRCPAGSRPTSYIDCPKTGNPCPACVLNEKVENFLAGS